MRELRSETGVDQFVSVPDCVEASGQSHGGVRSENRRRYADGIDLRRRDGPRHDARCLSATRGEGRLYVHAAASPGDRCRKRVAQNDAQEYETNETTFSLNSAFQIPVRPHPQIRPLSSIAPLSARAADAARAAHDPRASYSSISA